MNAEALIVPCETQYREFDAKLLLAGFAAERGFRVIIGAKKEINRRIASLPRSIFVSKSLTKRNLLMYELLERLGHSIVCGDEEALVYASPESYLHFKVSASTLQRAHALLAWGTENARIWRDYAHFHGVPIYVTGNARMDLLRPELRPFFDSEVEAIRSRFGAFILVNTNFSRLNHYSPRQSRQRRMLNAVVSRDEPNLDLGTAAHKASLLQGFLEMIPALSRACPDRTIVVRPHPSEKQETWREATRGCGNVEVVHEGNVAPWLLAGEVLIHNGCTTALEAYLLGAPAIAYQPVTSEAFDLQLPNLLSHRAFDLEQLVDLVKTQLSRGIPRDPTAEARKGELIDRYVASRTGAFASEQIVAALEAFAERDEDEGETALASHILARAAAGIRGAVQRFEAYVPGHHNNAKYLRHMFPGASLSDVQSRLDRFGSILDRFSKVGVRQLFDNVFEVAPL